MTANPPRLPPARRAVLARLAELEAAPRPAPPKLLNLPRAGAERHPGPWQLAPWLGPSVGHAKPVQRYPRWHDGDEY